MPFIGPGVDFASEILRYISAGQPRTCWGICMLTALPHGPYLKEMLQLGSLYGRAHIHVSKQLNGQGGLC